MAEEEQEVNTGEEDGRLPVPEIEIDLGMPITSVVHFSLLALDIRKIKKDITILTEGMWGLLESIRNIRQKTQALDKDVKLLREQIGLAPDGSLYKEAEADFASHAQTQKHGGEAPCRVAAHDREGQVHATG